MELSFIDRAIAFLSLIAIIVFVIFLIVLIVHFSTKRKNKFIERIWNLIKNNALLLIFIFSLASMLGSLYYSEIAEFLPCHLCWYQRILMYPLVLISAIALFKRKVENDHWHMRIMSGLGLVIAAYHSFLQYVPNYACGGVNDCGIVYVIHYGFVTIPLMAFIAFSCIFVLTFFLKTE